MNLGNNERRMLKGMLSEPKAKWTLDQILSVTDGMTRSTSLEQERGCRRQDWWRSKNQHPDSSPLVQKEKRPQRAVFLNQDSGIGSETKVRDRGTWPL